MFHFCASSCLAEIWRCTNADREMLPESHSLPTTRRSGSMGWRSPSLHTFNRCKTGRVRCSHGHSQGGALDTMAHASLIVYD